MRVDDPRKIITGPPSDRGCREGAIRTSEGQAKGELGYERTARPTGTRAEISGTGSRSRTRNRRAHRRFLSTNQLNPALTSSIRGAIANLRGERERESQEEVIVSKCPVEVDPPAETTVNPRANAGGRILIATSRSSLVSLAR